MLIQTLTPKPIHGNIKPYTQRETLMVDRYPAPPPTNPKPTKDFRIPLADHPYPERVLELVRSQEHLASKRFETMSDFNPLNSQHGRDVWVLLEEFKKIKPHLSIEDYFILLHFIRGVTLETIYTDHGVTLPNPLFHPTDEDHYPPDHPLHQAYNVLSELEALSEGATKMNKANMLWRIAVRNEERRPDLAISAINMLNKTLVAHGDLTPSTSSSPGSTNNGITLVLQNPALLRAPLDVTDAEVVNDG